MKNILGVALLSAFWVNVLVAQQKYPTGCLIDEATYLKTPMVAHQLTRNLLPSKVSLRAYCPTAQSQQPYNTCVGWSTAYNGLTTLKALAMNANGSAIEFDEAFSPSYVYNAVRKHNDCESSAYIHEALDFISNGCLKLSEFPFDCSVEVDEGYKTKAIEQSQEFRLTNYHRLMNYNTLEDADMTKIKRSVHEKKIVVIAFECFSSFQDLGADNNVWEGMEDSRMGNHALIIIGYDDEMAGGAFEVMNSWGASWGDNGFGWITYDQMRKYCKGAYEMSAELTSSKRMPDVEEKEYNLVAEIKFIKDSGEEMKSGFSRSQQQFRLINGYRSGTRFRINLANDDEAYMYVLGADASGEVAQLFPHNNNTSAFLPYTTNEIALPSERHFIKMDDKPGTGVICVLYSKIPIDISTIKQKIALAKGTDFIQNVKEAIKGRSISADNLSYSENGGISFKATMDVMDIVPVFVEIEHLK